MSDDPTTDTAALIAKIELDREVERYKEKQSWAEDQQRRQTVLERWVNVGMGGEPLPESAADYARLPMTTRLRIAAADPELARMLSPAVPLPAGTELRLKQGDDALLPEDVEPLLQAGHYEVVNRLKARWLERVWATHEENSAAEAAAREQGQRDFDAQVAAGQERFNAAMRSQYAERVRQGRG